jgi:DNA replication protein DnaC
MQQILDVFVQKASNQIERTVLCADLPTRCIEKGKADASMVAQTPDPTVADAICDRLTHNALKFNLEGDSMRKEKTKSATN